MKKRFFTALIASTLLITACSNGSSDIPPSPEPPKEILDQVDKLFDNNQPKAAIELLMPYSNSSKGGVETDIGYGYEEMKDIPQAIEWYKKAAKKNNKTAQYNLGLIYHRMNDYSRAFDYYEKSAKQDYAPAITQLGTMYYYGQKVKRNYVKAADYFKKASDMGNEWADYYLAICYIESHGVAQDLQKAKTLLLKAAKSGNPQIIDKINKL